MFVNLLEMDKFINYKDAHLVNSGQLKNVMLFYSNLLFRLFQAQEIDQV